MLYLIAAPYEAPSFYRILAEAATPSEAAAILVNARTLRWFKTGYEARGAVTAVSRRDAFALLGLPRPISDWRVMRAMGEPVPARDEESVECALELAALRGCC